MSRDYLAEFWGLLGGRKNDGVVFEQQKKLNMLITMSMIRLEKTDYSTRTKRREDFFDRRNEVHSVLQYPRCFCCGVLKTVNRHHIIQLKNGGPNVGRNIVSLCHDCNKKVHPWLDK